MVTVPSLATIRFFRHCALMNAVVAAPVLDDVELRRPAIGKRPERWPGCWPGLGRHPGANLKITVNYTKRFIGRDEALNEVEGLVVTILNIAPLRGQVQRATSHIDVVPDVGGIILIVVPT
jgi:hypothetical protein